MIFFSILLQLCAFAPSITSSHLLDIQAMFVEGKNAKEIRSVFQQYSLAQIKRVTAPQKEVDPQIDSPPPVKSRRGRRSLLEFEVNNKDILKNLDGTYISEYDEDEIKRRCTFIQGFRDIKFNSQGYVLSTWGYAEKGEMVTIHRYDYFFVPIYNKFDNHPTLPSLKSIREIWNGHLGIHESYMVDIRKMDGRFLAKVRVPEYHYKQICEKFGISEDALRGGNLDFDINMKECPVCFETRHCVKFECSQGAGHFMCTKCTQDWNKTNKDSTVFSCPMCRSEHGKDKIKKMLIKDQHTQVVRESV